MASQPTRISSIFAQIQTTSEEVQEAVVQAMGFLAYSRGQENYPIAAQTTTEALEKALDLLEQLRALRSALSNAKRLDTQTGAPSP